MEERIFTNLDFDWGDVVVKFTEVPALRFPDFEDELIAGPLGVLVSDLAEAVVRGIRATLNGSGFPGSEPIEVVIKMPRRIRVAQRP